MQPKHPPCIRARRVLHFGLSLPYGSDLDGLTILALDDSLSLARIVSPYGDVSVPFSVDLEMHDEFVLTCHCDFLSLGCKTGKTYKKR